MEDTPQNSSDSGYYFEGSRSLFESTPKTDNESTPLSLTTSRKRKASFLESYKRKNLADVIELSCSPSPQFSSTLNESLSSNLENVHIENEEAQKGATAKIFESYENATKKIRSAPNTPEMQLKPTRELGKKANTNSFVKNFSQFTVQSPLNKEAYGILYPDLPPLDPLRKPLTPQKFKESLEKSSTPAKKCLFTTSLKELFREVFTNNVIVSKIFVHLSDGDLYRLSMVSKTLKGSLMLDTKAYDRYCRFVRHYKGSKENYRITPPKSPKKDEGNAGDSPDSKNFYYFCSIATELNKNQSLVKCPRCNKASIVENFIGQCQDVNRCGYIFCQKCNSFANNPKDFKDKCNNAQLVNVRRRSRLGDLSNATVTSDYATDSGSSFFTSSSLNMSLSNKYDSSGFFSEGEANTSLLAVKRNLSQSFTSPYETKPRALSSSNTRVGMHHHRLQRRSSLLSVVQTCDSTAKTTEIVEPSSPPKIKPYSVCSKQSKRNLKRLTR
ncbi:hypothetical protein NQ318_001957 [Aromia moschata]|uniref:F-box domain-containing protein n=1 Tax=Aromia moschata TaxID=1265417 RepID=A0AAV8Z1M9_9CUCU|nr:hypothetical protein NQ318_001957 [Aromia moschata]